jgi:hypothetical protein
MTNRFPLIANSSTNQIQELASGDNLDLSSSSIVNAVSIGATNISAGVITATSFVGSFTGTITGTASTASFATTSFGLSGSPNISVGNITSGNINSSGIVTATSFVGSGANLTGVISGVEIKSAGTSVGTGITNINFVGATATATGSASTITITVTSSFNELDAALFS